ncbi:MAG: hypothetical protein B6I28_02415 [Fusobacteriia bacterium 4572_132]|nr:MAG: hypothetical protein B6I28_02415 [Fusobacteriia bacterium 4572_132]
MGVLKNIVSKDLIITKCKMKDREELFEKIAELVLSKGYIENKDDFLKGIWERENQISTEIAKGIGMPHIKSDIVKKDFIVVIISKEGIKYGGFNKKVNLIFCIGVEKDSKTYLNIMAKIARFLSKEEIKKSLINSDVPEDVMKLISDFEKVEIVKTEGQKNKYLATIIINKVVEFDKVMELAIETGLVNPTIIDSTYGIRKMFFDIPFLNTFALFSDKNISSKILIGITEDKEYAKRLAGVLKNEEIDIEQEGKGIIFLQKLEDVVGGNDDSIDI